MFWRRKQPRRPVSTDLTFVDPQFRRLKHEGADWSGQTFENFIPVGCEFRSCSFENAIFKTACFGGGLEDSLYVNCSFDRSTIWAMAAGNARFEACSFRDVEVFQFFAHSIEIIDCVFSGIVKQAYFNGTVPVEDAGALGRKTNEFRGNDFSGATFVDVAFRTGIDLSQQKLPEGWQNEPDFDA